MILSTIYEQNPPNGLGGDSGQTDRQIDTHRGATGINNIHTFLYTLTNIVSNIMWQWEFAFYIMMHV